MSQSVKLKMYVNYFRVTPDLKKILFDALFDAKLRTLFFLFSNRTEYMHMLGRIHKVGFGLLHRYGSHGRGCETFLKTFV